MNSNLTAAIFMTVCAVLCGTCAIIMMSHKKLISMQYSEQHPIQSQWPPVHQFKPIEIKVKDTSGDCHTVLTREFGFNGSELVESLEGHALVSWIDPKTGSTFFIHAQPCKKCYELKNYAKLQK